MGKLFFYILATFAEFEADLISLRTRKGIAIARDKVKLHGKQRELCRMPRASIPSAISTSSFLSLKTSRLPHTLLGPPYTVSSQRRIVPGKSQ